MPTTSSGLQYEDITPGTGAEALSGRTMQVHYSGWLREQGWTGALFDSSCNRGQPFTFVLGQGMVIADWDEGVAGMKVGGRRRLIIPPALGYGVHGIRGMIPPTQ